MALDDQRPYAADWSRELFANQEAYQYVSGVAVHWYKDRQNDDVEPLQTVHEEFPDKFIFYSEACTGEEYL